MPVFVAASLQKFWLIESAAEKDQSVLQTTGATANQPDSQLSRRRGLSVSPDGKLLVVSNRTNGSLFVLKAALPTLAGAETNSFRSLSQLIWRLRGI
jgi:glucose/arabinose dehydrogenase